MVNEADRDRLLALLAWWREAGVGDVLVDEPIDWTRRGDLAPGAAFELPGRERAAPPSPANQPPVRQTSLPPRAAAIAPAPRPAQAPRGGEVEPTGAPVQRPPSSRREPQAVVSAREAARAAQDLDELEALLKAFDGCAFKATAKSLCFYRGSPLARLMIIGEAPGRDEDIAGKPFVGRAGQLLDKMLAAIGLGEADVHITNVVYWRPPGNRTPTPEEAQACKPFLERQMELVAPDVVLTLGGPAAKAILDVPDGIIKLRGRWREIRCGGRVVRVMPTLHPAYLLRQPEAKRQAWRDLLQIKVALEGGAGEGSGSRNQ